MTPAGSPPASLTISILNYERRDLLRQSLALALAQECPGLEVLVVDNASTDGSAEMVLAEFPQARLVRLPRNIGCAARNAGVEAARGEVVVTIDNDVLLESPGAARSVLALMARHPRAACVNFKIVDRHGRLSTRDWCHPREWARFADEEFLTDYVLEGASAFRRQAFLDAGGYWPALFLGHEGLDLALRLVDAGHDLVYTPGVVVTHLASPEARPSSRIYYTFTRNSIWVALRNHRIPAAALALSKDVALMGFSSLRAGHTGSYLRGLWHAVRGLRDVLRLRRPLRAAAYRRLREVRRLQPGVLAKALRHWRERPI